MKILLFDIETAPNRGFIWSIWKEVMSYNFIESDWFIMCWAAKWLDEKKIHSCAITDFKRYKKDPECDKEVLAKLWKLLDEADCVVAHNAIKFDRRKVNTRFILHGMTPPSPYTVIDTLVVARKEFNFTSNKLNDIAKFLGLGEKHDTDGFKLWTDCLLGIKTAWKKMVNYCKQDVNLLEKVYLKLRPYITQHPNFNVYNDYTDRVCPKCGSDDIHYRGYAYTSISKFHRFICNACGGWSRDRSNCFDKDKMKTVITNVN